MAHRKASVGSRHLEPAMEQRRRTARRKGLGKSADISDFIIISRGFQRDLPKLSTSLSTPCDSQVLQEQLAGAYPPTAC